MWPSWPRTRPAASGNGRRGNVMSSTSTTISPTARWLTHLRRETERFADVARTSPLRAHVPAYPDFTVHSLAAHIGRGLRLFHAIAAGGGEQPGLEVPGGAVVAGWVLDGLAPLVTALDEIPPDQLVPFPHNTGDRPVGLIATVLAVEVGVRRWGGGGVLRER